MRISCKQLEKIKCEFGEFDINQIENSKHLYLRFGYWKQIDLEKLENILGFKVNEDVDYDDDCGSIFMYNF